MGNEVGTLGLARDLAILQALQQAANNSDDEDIIWDEDDRSKLMVVSDDGHTVKRLSPIQFTTDAVRAKTGYRSGIHIWDISWPRNQRGNYANIGIATQSSTLQYIGQTDLIGGNDESVGWNLSRKVALYNDCVISKYPANKPANYQIPDKITVVLDMNVGVLRFKIGDEDLGVCASGLKGKQASWYPAVSSDTNATITIQKFQTRSPDRKTSQVATRPAVEATSAPLRFYPIYGKHIQLGSDRRSAERQNPALIHDKAIVLTARPLKNDELFEVEITQLVAKWSGTVEIGATTVSPKELDFPATMTDSEQETTWMYSGNTIMKNGTHISQMDVNCNILQVGAKVGVMRKGNGNLVFFVNGKQVGTGALQTPPGLFGVVDVYGKTSGIRITSPALLPSQSTPRPDSQQQVRPTTPASLSEPLNFHRRCGKNVTLSSDKLTAERRDPQSNDKEGVVITEKPLVDGSIFSVKLVKTVDKWNPSLKIGVIQMLAGCTEIPAVSTSSDECCVWSGNDVLYKRNYVGSLSKNLNGAKVGTKVGLKYDTDGTLTFYMDDQCVGTIKQKISGKLHGVVDVYGKTAQVTIINPTVGRGRETAGVASTTSSTAGATYGTTPSRSELEGILALMRRAVLILSDPQHHSLAELAKIIQSLEGRISELSGDKEKQLFGDKFSDIGGGKALTTALMFLRAKSVTDESTQIVDLLILGFCWNSSNNSLKFCEAVGDAGLLEQLTKGLYELKATYSSENIQCRKVTASIGILHNCAKAAGTKEIFKKQSIRQALREYRTADNPAMIVALSILALSYICDPPEEESAENLKYMVKMLEGCTKNSRHSYTETFSGGSPSFYSIEIMESLTSIARNVKNRTHLVEAGVTLHLVWILQNGDGREREQAANAIWTLVDEKTRWKVSQTKDVVESLTVLKDTDNEALNQAATRACLKLLTQGFGQGDLKAASQSCDYRKLASRLFKSMQLDDAFFNTKFHGCYCAVCHAERGDQLYYSRGTPEKDYGLPIGWFRFGLHVPARATAKDVDALNKWHRCFHGTKKETLKNILETGELLQPGDVALGGKKLGEREGHFTDDRKPSGFDTKQIFLSPSIRYSGHSAYATPFKYKDEESGTTYVARVAFQVFIRPGSYEAGDQTIGATEQIDPRFSNQELEWATKERGATILNGLLVKLDESKIQ